MFDVPIQVSDLDRVVDQLYQHTTQLPTETPLLYLQLVEDVLAQPSYPRSESAREQALLEVISGLITNTYVQLAGIPRKDILDNQVNPDQTIVTDSKFRDRRILIGYSYLYFCHVAVHFGIRFAHFAEISGIPERSLQRYKAEAINDLHRRLIALERDSRRNAFQLSLLRALPNLGQKKLYGRDGFISHCVRLITQSKVKRLALIGEAGMGKSAITEALVQALISAEVAQWIVWIDHAHSLDHIRDAVETALMRHGASAATMLTMYNVIIVLDGLSRLQWVSEIWAEFKPFAVLATARQWDSHARLDAVLEVPPADDITIRQLIRAELDQQGLADIGVDELDFVVRDCAGNPGHIIHAVRHWLLADVRRIGASTNNLSNEAWCVGLLGPTFVSYEDIKHLWRWLGYESAFPSLSDLERNSEFSVTQLGSQAYVQLQREIFALFVQSLDELLGEQSLNQLQSLTLVDSVLSLRLITNVLEYTGRPERLTSIIKELLDRSYELHREVSWSSFLRLLRRQLIVYPESLRRRVFILSAHMARIGNNVREARAFLENVGAISANSQEWIEYKLEAIACDLADGQYHSVYHGLRSIERLVLSAHNHPQDYVERFTLAKAQFLVDVRDFESLEQFLAEISQIVPQELVSALQVEISLLTPSRSLGMSLNTFVTRSKLHEQYILGLQYSESQPQRAIQYWLSASQLALRRLPEDLLVVGRCLCNAGVCYLKISDQEKARLHLEQARQIQEHIHDNYGLIFTRKNLSLIQ